jgi:hypothetical protein
MKIKNHLIPFATFLIYAPMFIFSGCIERHYSYKINLDGSCEFHYKAKGDSADIYEPLGSYPESPFFRITTSREMDDSGRVSFVLEAWADYRGDSIPAVLGLREVPWTQILLHHPARMKRSTFFFLSTYNFELTFKGRQRESIEGDRWKFIPQECRILEEGNDSLLTDSERAVLEEKYAAGMLLWNLERYRLRFREIIQRAMELHPEAQIPQAWVDSARSDLDSLLDLHFRAIQYLAAEKKLDEISLEWWEALGPAANKLILENLNMFGDSALPGEVLRISELLEMQHHVSEDLIDESFEVRVDMPGRITRSNAPTMDKGVIVWKYVGEDFAGEDVVLQASSLYLFSGRIVGIIIALALIFALWRFGRRKPSADGPPPPPPKRRA